MVPPLQSRQGHHRPHSVELSGMSCGEAAPSRCPRGDGAVPPFPYPRKRVWKATSSFCESVMLQKKEQGVKKEEGCAWCAWWYTRQAAAPRGGHGTVARQEQITSPIGVRTAKGRGHHSTKGYIAAFVCFVTRAMYLELVSDYSTPAFLAVFHRFTTKCGMPSITASTIFIEADQELRTALQAAGAEGGPIAKALVNNGTEWRFRTSGAPLWRARRSRGQIDQAPSPSGGWRGLLDAQRALHVPNAG